MLVEPLADIPAHRHNVPVAVRFDIVDGERDDSAANPFPRWFGEVYARWKEIESPLIA